MSQDGENAATGDSGSAGSRGTSTNENAQTTKEDARKKPATVAGGRADEGDDSSDSDLYTRDPRLRLESWATIAAGLVLGTFYGLWAFLLYTGTTRPEFYDGVAYLGVLFALVWTFGVGTARAVRRFRKGVPLFGPAGRSRSRNEP